jgi:hypothetical protein
MTSFNRYALLLIMTAMISAAMTTTTTDYNNNNSDDDIVMQRRQMVRERGNNSNNNSSSDTTTPMTTTTTRGLSSHTTCQGDDCASCTTSPTVPNATTLIFNLLAVNNNHENIQIVNVTTSSHACYKLFTATNNGPTSSNNSLLPLLLPREGGIIMSTGAPDTFCNININNKQSTNWGQLGDEDLESLVNVNNYSNLTATQQQQQRQQQQQTTIPTHDAVRRSPVYLGTCCIIKMLF